MPSIPFASQFAALIFMLLLVGCQRPVNEVSSSLRIQIPSKQELAALMSKNSVSSTVDLTKMCFAVSITGPKIPGTAALSCDVERGMTSAALAEGELSVDGVPVGSDAKIEVFGFLRDQSSDACPSLGATGWGGYPLSKVYSLAEKAGVEIVSPSTSIELTLQAPSLAQNIAVIKSFPANCTTSTNTSGFYGQVVMGVKDLQSASYKMRARVSQQGSVSELNGTNFKFRGGVR